MNRATISLLLVLSLLWLGSPLAHGAVTLIGEYRLGEAGSTTGATFAPLIDSAGTANNIISFQNAGGQSLATTGLAAPGSTAAIRKTAFGTGWFDNAVPFGLNNNWAVDMWIRPESNAGTIAFQTANSVNGLSFWYQVPGQGGDISIGTGAGGSATLVIDGPDYALNQWQRLTMITLNNTVNYYVDGQFHGSAIVATPLLDQPMIGFGQGGASGTSASFDELRIYSFAGTDSLAAITGQIFGLAVPEPTTVGAWSLAGCAAAAWLLFSSRRRRHACRRRA